jgi:hypothetical protein
LAAKVKMVYCAFARIVTAVIVLAFGVLSHLLTFKIGPIENQHIIFFNGTTFCQNRDTCHHFGIRVDVKIPASQNSGQN